MPGVSTAEQVQPCRPTFPGRRLRGRRDSARRHRRAGRCGDPPSAGPCLLPLRSTAARGGNRPGGARTRAIRGVPAPAAGRVLQRQNRAAEAIGSLRLAAVMDRGWTSSLSHEGQTPPRVGPPRNPASERETHRRTDVRRARSAITPAAATDTHQARPAVGEGAVLIRHRRDRRERHRRRGRDVGRDGRDVQRRRLHRLPAPCRPGRTRVVAEG
jgi:hypothetical protein